MRLEVHPVHERSHQLDPSTSLGGGIRARRAAVEAPPGVDHGDDAVTVVEGEVDLVLLTGAGVPQGVGAGFGEGNLDVGPAIGIHAHLTKGIAAEVTDHRDALLVAGELKPQFDLHSQ